MTRRTMLFLWMCLLALGGCEADDWGPKKLSHGKTLQEAQIEQLRRGRKVYATYCVGCHGENGDGKGKAARFLDPKPRDFTLGLIKFARVPSGEFPRDVDYLRVIEHGLSGTAMPSFRFLSVKEKRAVVAYVRNFYEEELEAPGAPVEVGEDPWFDDPEGGIAEGEKVYHGIAKCWSCHPAFVSPEKIAEYHEAYGLGKPGLRENLYESKVTDSQWGAPIRPPNFLIDRIKTGAEVENLVYVIASGVGGTAMPTWAGILEPEQLWGLAHYVHDLAMQRGSKAAIERHEALAHDRSEGGK
ncbi:MAG: hypothetical protein D6795_17710 [Deltaproteobacteria bacterium]|nr:MAG: hypothetical protein D6795_17710 [Deltaproteobacteria bacterium]